MTITLTPEQHKWIAERVTRGEFPSVEDAVRELLDSGIAGHNLDEDDDLSWAKADIDEAMSAYERGEYVTHEEYRAQMAKFLKTLPK